MCRDHGGEVPADIEQAQRAIQWCDHLVIVYPLWLGTMPALLKGFLEQTMRYGFALSLERTGMPKRLLKGKSARLIVTMGMPGWIYRWFFGAHSLKSLERNILRFAGIKPIRESIYGMVEAASDATRAGWLSVRRRASLAAAGHLALDGHSVTIFEKRAYAGGLNTTGVAPYKLHAPDSLKEVQMILDLGDITLKTGVEIVDGDAGDGQVSTAQLESDYDAVFIGRSKRLRVGSFTNWRAAASSCPSSSAAS